MFDGKLKHHSSIALWIQVSCLYEIKLLHWEHSLERIFKSSLIANSLQIKKKKSERDCCSINAWKRHEYIYYKSYAHAHCFTFFSSFFHFFETRFASLKIFMNWIMYIVHLNFICMKREWKENKEKQHWNLLLRAHSYANLVKRIKRAVKTSNFMTPF